MIKKISPSQNYRQAGNIFFMLFASVALVGAIGVGASNHLKGIVTSMSEVTRKTVAEEKMTGGARLSIQAATGMQMNEGDCDADGMVEPLPYRDAGTAVHPTGGGYLPLNIGVEPLDPWGTPYGYCVWDAGTTFDHADCGGPGARRLRGSPTTTHPVVAVISAGKDRRFSTTCNAYVDTTPADGIPDTAMIGRAVGGDDIILEYTYNDASGMSGDDLWKVRDTTPDTAMIDKNIEVTGSGQFSGPINLMQAGLVLPADPGNNSVTGPCNATTDQQLRVNTGTSPPSFEICHTNTWSPIAMGASGAGNYNTPTQTGKLLASDAAALDWLGNNVAISGNYAIAGAQMDDNVGADAGAAYIYSKTGGTWTQYAKLTASDAAAGDNFGMHVGISGDNAIIGAPNNDDNGSNSGSVYIFTRSGGGWSEAAKLTASDAAANDNFGSRVAISGNYAIVGAPNNDDNGSNSGSAYIFTKTNGVWVQTAKLTASDASAGDGFGLNVSISGNNAIISASLDSDLAAGAGSAYIFTRTGSNWTQTAKITASDPGAGDNFGVGVGISGDNAVVGAAFNDDNGSDSGSVYIFKKSAGTWSQTAKIIASDAAAGDHFGRSIGISGNTLVVGAPNNDDGGSNSGSAYVFKLSGGTWTENAKITAADAAAGDGFGLSVGVSGDSAIVGAYLNDDGAADSGSAYIFEGLCLGQPCGSLGNGDEVLSVPTKGLMMSPSFLQCSAAGKGPLVKVSESDSGDYRHLAIDKNYLYAASTTSGLSAFSKNSGILTRITTQFSGTLYASLWANGTHVFAATTTTGVAAYTFDGTTFTAAGTATTVDARSIWGDGKYIYVADGAAGIKALTYNGATFTTIASFDTPGLAADIWGDGRFLYVSDRTGGLRILSFDGAAFSEIEIAQTGDDVLRSWGDGNFIYIVYGAGNTLKRFSFDGENLTPYVDIPLINNTFSVWGDGSNIFTGSNLGLLSAGYLAGNSLSVTGNHPINSVQVRNITGDGNYVYASAAGVGPVFAFSGYACGTSVSPNPATILGANEYYGKIAASGNYSCGIKSDGTAWCWGHDASGRLGNGVDGTEKQSPSLVSSLTTQNNFTQIVTGGSHTCGIRNNGSAWCWGYDAVGQLGNGAVLSANQQSPSPVTTAANETWVQIAAGLDHTCGIKAGGTAWCWGDGTNGRLGNGGTAGSVDPVPVSGTGPWVMIGAGTATSCGIKVDGTLWCWGLNSSGELGNGSLLSSSVPTPVVEPGPWSYVGSHSSTVCAVKLDGSAWCWGNGRQGKRADNINEITNLQVVPKRISDPGPWLQMEGSVNENATSCGLKVDGSAWCWGYSGEDGTGRRGDGVLTVNTIAYPVRVNDPGPWASITMGATHACGLKVDGSAWCWGSDGMGALGNGPVIGNGDGSPSRVYNFSNTTPWQWNAAQTSATKANPSAQVIVPSNSYIGYDDASGGLSFDTSTRTVLRTPSGNAELMVETMAASSSAQISFDAQHVANAKSIGIDHTNFNLEFGVNNGTASNWMSAITPQMSITPDRNVIMGSAATAGARLDVRDSGLKVGNETRTCAPSRQGTLRYVGGVIGFEYCNGTAWVTF